MMKSSRLCEGIVFGVMLSTLVGCLGELTVAEGTGGAGGVGGAAGQGGASSSSSSPTVSSSGAGGSTGAEMCTNGVDDDGDGVADCADAECAGTHRCLPTAPEAWGGPFWARKSQFGANPPLCASGAPPLVLPTAPSSGACNACACALTGGTCSSNDAKVICYDNASCSGNGMSYGGGAGCYSLLGTANQSCMVTAVPQPSVNTVCSATGGGLSQPAPFAESVYLCDALGGGAGCELGNTCALAPDPLYADYACIVHDGEAPCPAGWDVKFSTAVDWMDTRSCSGCACDGAGIYCPVDMLVQKSSSLTCIGGTSSPVPLNQCVGFKTSDSIHIADTVSPALSPQACPSPTSSGAVAILTTKTVCCAQTL